LIRLRAHAKAEIEGDMGDSHMGLQARLMSQALRKLTGTISKSKTCVIFINQIREKIGVMFGNPETTTGGRALKFYSSVRLDLRRISYIKSGEEVIGSRVRVRVVKNKVAPPFKETEIDFLHAEGISKESDLIDTGVNLNILQKSGAWILMGEEKLGQGRDAARMFLKANSKVASEIESGYGRNARKVAGLRRRPLHRRNSARIFFMPSEKDEKEKARLTLFRLLKFCLKGEESGQVVQKEYAWGIIDSHCRPEKIWFGNERLSRACGGDPQKSPWGAIACVGTQKKGVGEKWIGRLLREHARV
jgi:hypothetical protein